MNPFVIAFRRIIPLKLLLVLLAVFGVLFACFSSVKASDIYVETEIIVPKSSLIEFDSSEGYSVLCVNNYDCPSGFCIRTNDGGGNNCESLSNISTVGNSLGLCITQSSFSFYRPNSTCSIMVSKLYNTDYTSLQCQTEYNLIPVESVDQNYCTTNNLCPSGGTPSDCPNVGVSNLYINDIFHPGAFNIVMNIPQEIDWDYAYTNSGQNFNIDVVGYNQDFEKIEGWIETNNYKPTSEDFTKIFTSFSSFGGLLIACLFVILVFYFVKKMFK